jgi:hypothetical protein
MRHVILAALAVGMAAVLYWSPKPYMLTNLPMVDQVAALPPGTDVLKLRRFLNYSAYVIPKAEADSEAQVQPPALGYSYREVSVLKLPLFAYADQGKVLYIEIADRVQMVPLDADYLALLEKEAGQPLGRDYSFPWWKHVWGWAFLLGFVLWWVLQVRAERRREFESEAYA